jgi:hypothetical protein
MNIKIKKDYNDYMSELKEHTKHGLWNSLITVSGVLASVVGVVGLTEREDYLIKFLSIIIAIICGLSCGFLIYCYQLDRLSEHVITHFINSNKQASDKDYREHCEWHRKKVVTNGEKRDTLEKCACYMVGFAFIVFVVAMIIN